MNDMDSYTQRDMIKNKCKCCKPPLCENSYIREKLLYARDYELTHNATQYAQHALYSTQYDESAFVRRVPVIRSSRDEMNINMNPVKYLTRDHAINDYSRDKAYSVSSSDISERRSISPIYSIYNQEARDYSIKEKNEGFLKGNKYKTEKLTIIFNEDQTMDGKHISEHNQSGYYTPPTDNSPSNIPYNTRFIYPNTNIESLSTNYTGQPTVDYSTLTPGLSQRGTRKRVRTIYTPSQLKKLEDKFTECSFIVGEDRQMLAKDLKLREQQVKIWFQNRRTKCKQCKTKLQDA